MNYRFAVCKLSPSGQGFILVTYLQKNKLFDSTIWYKTTMPWHGILHFFCIQQYCSVQEPVRMG